MKKVVYTITKEVGFSAAHLLEGVHADHPCGQLHGHNYKAYVTLKGRHVDQVGFLLDFSIIRDLIKGRYDHTSLNDVMVANPTAENLAYDILRSVNEVIFRLNINEDVRVTTVTVQETETGSATVHVLNDGDSE